MSKRLYLKIDYLMGSIVYPHTTHTMNIDLSIVISKIIMMGHLVDLNNFNYDQIYAPQLNNDPLCVYAYLL